VSTTSKRRRQLAHAKYERQQARRAESASRAKRRNAVIASFVAVALVIGGVAFLAIQTSDEPETDTNPAAAATTAPSATPSAAQAPVPCTYKKAGKPAKPVQAPKYDAAAAAKPYTATLATSQGAIAFAADTAGAPCTTYSFRHLAEAKFFDSTKCHRLSENATFGILQCGDPTATGQGGPGYQLPDENLSSLKDLIYPAGTVAMANSGPNTNGSQFFFVYKETKLPPSYTPFGRVTKGLDVVQKIAKGGVIPGPSSATDGKPKLDVTIKSVRISAS
jgi:peptidyl-prolyl cis-trans isomerase B (cyclophilin B)